ncbi:MAG: hypothetical protein FWF82_05150 [Oscillospiraceae bacterium]|nr:hypothetical protein [Oscillospiraceae bacterium]
MNIKKRKSNISAAVAMLLVFAVFVGFVFVMLNNASKTSSEEALRAAEASVVRAVVSCYAFEGFYPDNIDYLVEHYNLVIDRDKYLIYYGKSAENIMPNVIVTERVL